VYAATEWQYTAAGGKIQVTMLFTNVCKATSVTHTKRIYRNLLRKETSFV